MLAHLIVSSTSQLNASVTTRRTCYGSCVSGAAAELRLKFCISCGWLGSESDSAATVPATHASCGRRASDAPNCTQKIQQRRHVQRTGAMPSRYLQRAFAVPPVTCPYGGVRVCTSVARRRCFVGTPHARSTHGYIRVYIYIYYLSSTLLKTVKTHQLTWHGTPGDWDCSGCNWWQRDSAETTLSWPWLLGKDNGFKKKERCDSIGLRTFCWSWWADRFPPRLYGALTLRFGSNLLAELKITLGIISLKQ